MKKTPSPRILPSSQRNQISNFQYGPTSNSTNRRQQHKTHPSLNHVKAASTLNYVKAAAKKVAAVFTTLFGRQRKQSSRGAIIDVSRSKNQTRGILLARDLSTGSNGKGSSTFKSSNSYGSSIAAIGQAVEMNFSIEEVCKATENFSLANKIGAGGSGTVYKGTLANGSLVAVKRAKKNIYDNRLLLEFRNEIIALSKIEHLNLVRLYGYLEHEDEQIIVVEFVGNGTLREHLDCTRGNGLEIAERLEIAIDIAHAITYLHMYADTPIIHRDIKASNILITEKLRAKVTDFGFARLATEDPNASHISTQIKGTTGYLDPEYVRTYQLTEKSDVYSFGVLLVEMMTGRRPIDSKRPQKERVTIRWAMQKLKEGDAIIAMDPRLRRSPASNLAVEKVLKLALQCLASSRESRPSMKECAEVLWGIRKEMREKAFSSSPSAPHQSANFPNAKQSRRALFGIEDGESYKFISA